MHATAAARAPIGVFPRSPALPVFWVGEPRPIRARVRHLGARFRWSDTYTATDSGAVSAGSNPAGGTGQRHKFEHLNNLVLTKDRVPDLRRCSDLPGLAPDTCPENRHQPGRGLFSRTRRQRPSGRRHDRRPLLFPVSAARQRQYRHRPGAAAQLQRGSPAGPGPALLEGCGGCEDRGVRGVVTRDLQSNREAIVGPARGHGNGGISGVADRLGVPLVL